MRHGATRWNAQGRIQGQSEQPLSPAGRASLAGLRVPPAFASFAWTTSPLGRARETAKLLGGRAIKCEPRLIEMDWGGFAGRTLKDLRAELGADLARLEALGLDFRPPGGESPRDVQLRLTSYMRQVAASGRDTIAVTHKGVIRAALAVASDWDMTVKPPVKLAWLGLHEFRIDGSGALELVRANIPLVAR
jgi:probable phosphoglycerate mutase